MPHTTKLIGEYLAASGITAGRRLMPHTKLIGEYLAASGITAIVVVKLPKGYGISVGRMSVTRADAVSTYWVEKTLAAKIARAVRTVVPTDRATVERELLRSSSNVGARLTPNNIVISRATDAAKRLESYLAIMNKTGGLAEFNKEFKRRRQIATARGNKFPSFSTATTRLRKGLIRMLIDKRQLRTTTTLFDEVFK